MSYANWQAKKKAFAIKKRKEEEAKQGSRYRLIDFEQWYPYIAFFGVPLEKPGFWKERAKFEMRENRRMWYDREVHRSHAEEAAKHLLDILHHGVHRADFEDLNDLTPPIFPPRTWDEFALAYSWRNFTEVYKRVPTSDLRHTMEQLHLMFGIEGTDEASIEAVFEVNKGPVWQQRRYKENELQDLRGRRRRGE